jgi:hypothetical protein
MTEDERSKLWLYYKISDATAIADALMRQSVLDQIDRLLILEERTAEGIVAFGAQIAEQGVPADTYELEIEFHIFPGFALMRKIGVWVDW